MPERCRKRGDIVGLHSLVSKSDSLARVAAAGVGVHKKPTAAHAEPGLVIIDDPVGGTALAVKEQGQRTTPTTSSTRISPPCCRREKGMMIEHVQTKGGGAGRFWGRLCTG